MNGGLEYNTSTLSFDQTQVPRSTVRLIFAGERPDWVRAYGVTDTGRVQLVNLVTQRGDLARDLIERTGSAVDAAEIALEFD